MHAGADPARGAGGGGQRGNGAQNREKHIVFEEHREVGKVSNWNWISGISNTRIFYAPLRGGPTDAHNWHHRLATHVLAVGSFQRRLLVAQSN